MSGPERGGPPVQVGLEASKFLDGILRLREARSGRAVSDAWLKAVGSRVAKVARPVGLADGVLRVRVASPVWRNEIRMRASEIVERLRTVLGDSVRTLDVGLGTNADMRDGAGTPAADPGIGKAGRDR